MGSGIAQVCALAGYDVLIYDESREMLSKGMKTIHRNLSQGFVKGKISKVDCDAAKKRIRKVVQWKDLISEMVIEAVVENLEVKRKLFTRLEILNPDAILATNTSSIRVSQIASALKRPARCVGLHFFNPAHIMKLVEIVSGDETSAEVAELTRNFALSLNKVPVMAKDSPGFIVNHVARHYYLESLKLLEDMVAGVEAIDRLLESSGFKMGPFRLMDLIGIDVNLAVTQIGRAHV